MVRRSIGWAQGPEMGFELMGRANWYHGKHPPTCTCVSCTRARRAAPKGLNGLLRRLLALFGLR